MEKLKKNLLLATLSFIASTLFLLHSAHAHCQIPCGIYNDHARVQTMLEDVATIEKATKFIAESAGKTDAQSKNQLVRWVMNKEKHAQNIISIISDYFLTQRVKPDQQNYAQRLQQHHAVIVAAMKAKQHADKSYATALRISIERLLAYYPKQ